MPSLLDIKARIKAVENIKKITRAMQLVAAAKFNRAQNRARSARPYSEELDKVLGVLAAMSESDADGSYAESLLELSFVDGEPPLSIDRGALFEQKEVKKPGIVLFTSDRGLAGAFNTRLIRAAASFAKEHPDMDPRLITIGRKGNQYFKRREIPILHHEETVSDKLELSEIKRITGKLVGLFVEGEVDALYLIYAKFRTAMQSDVTTDKFLSIPPVAAEKGSDIYILEPDRDAVYETLIPLYATTKIFATLADSFASEHGARMVAMQLATKNAEEMLDELIILRNRMRQAIITKELAEIVGGAGDFSS
jgi:F-type H+-transporting ATPase subunit gamma